MNANEVIANRAIELLGGEKGDYSLVNPNDHVNCGQSTNDVIPTAGKMTTLRASDRSWRPSWTGCVPRLRTKPEEFDHVIKMGRTQMQDAVPIRLGQEFRAYCRRRAARHRAHGARPWTRCARLNMGGTAIGTGINADEAYLRRIVPDAERGIRHGAHRRPATSSTPPRTWTRLWPCRALSKPAR